MKHQHCETTRPEKSEKKEDAAIRKGRVCSFIHEESFEQYDPVVSLFSFGDPCFPHGDLLPVVHLYQMFRLNKMINKHTNMVLR